MHGELQGKNVGVFAISAHPKEKVDEMVAKVSLPFKVRFELCCTMGTCYVVT